MGFLLASPYFNPSSWTHEDWVEIREWMVAIGTVGATIVALALALGWLDFLTRPKLRAKALRRLVTGEVGSPALVFRLPILGRGRGPARDVNARVVAISVWSTQRQAWEPVLPTLVGLDLEWANGRRAPVNIVRSATIEAELFQIIKDNSNPHQLPIHLVVNGSQHDDEKLWAGQWLLEIEITADNAKPVRRFVSVGFDGVWWPSDAWSSVKTSDPARRAPRRPPQDD